MSTDPFDLTGRVVVVTGGLGLLGRQFTAAVAARGARAVALDLAAASTATPPPAGVRVVHADVRDRGALEAALATIRAEVGVPHALINGAAIDSPPDAPSSENGPFETYPLESWNRVIDVNVTGLMLCCQVFGAAMAEAGRGSIVNISSIYGVVSPDQRIYAYRAEHGAPFVKPAAYSASKSALLNLSRYLATYWAPRGVRVNTLTLAGVANNQDARFLEGYCARIPVGRMARPDEYNGAVVFLCSDASAYMTGANLVMDGGWTAW
jgi:NAD(P)-dependent dehydrogenase (short-subunit alcohol dehydrogenase family)